MIPDGKAKIVEVRLALEVGKLAPMQGTRKVKVDDRVEEGTQEGTQII